MKSKTYLLLFSMVFLLDRFSKYWMFHTQKSYTINSFLSFYLTFNRGIAWGIFNDGNESTFLYVSTAIAVVYFFFLLFTMYRWCKNAWILPEILILAGGCSNLMDRFSYGAVVDFIVWSIGSWSWPAFNIADSAIVLGTFMLGIACIKEK